MPLLRTAGLALLLFGSFPAARSAAQVRASEPATVSQTVAGTVITIEYSRPVARGRALFGALVPWEVVWTPGANWATTFEVSRDVRLNGQPVPAGKYSLWMVPRPGAWTVFLSDRARAFHTQRPGPEDAAARFEVVPVEGAPMEALAFCFPEVRSDGATLRMHWGTTVVAMDVAVTSGSGAPAPR